MTLHELHNLVGWILLVIFVVIAVRAVVADWRAQFPK